MNRPIKNLTTELPSAVVQRRQWIHKLERRHQDEARAGMEMFVSVILLGVVSTCCLLAWVLW